METSEAIETRRSIRQFDPEHRMSEEEIRKLLSATLRSPTSFNIQHWRFVLIRDEKMRREVRKVAWKQAQVTDASLLVLICGDAQAWSKQPERYWVNAPKAASDFLVAAISNVYQGSPEWQRDEVMRSAGIASQTLMLMARDMGYDSCPMVGFDFEEVGRMVRLPDDHLIAMMVAIGRPLQPPQARGGQLPYQEVVLENRFP